MAQAQSTPRDYYWTWYDQQSPGARNWILAANPSSSATPAHVSVTIGEAGQDVTAFGGPSVDPGGMLVANYWGLMNGPVTLASLEGNSLVASQRTLWAGSSLEEVPAIDAGDLAATYYWTWYDQNTPGFTDWILIANPNPTGVFYRITIAGEVRESGSIDAHASVTPSFPGLIGGPVQVEAWSDSVGGSVPANVISSQRVLSNYGEAFNELPGKTVADLSSRYAWTWYDNLGAGVTDWMIIANPNAEAVFYEIRIDGTSRASGRLEPGQYSTPTFPGVRGGPVEVYGWSDSVHGSVPAGIIASQRVLWGTSFEEQAGTPVSALGSDYFWTWYDQRSAGSINWVLVSNPDPLSQAFYEVWIAGVRRASGNLPAGATVTPSFPGLMTGPVEVRGYANSDRSSPASLISSQRVLWNGHFNEVSGTSLGIEAPHAPPDAGSIFPADNIWNQRVDSLPRDSNSDAYVNSIGRDDYLHPDFGSGLWDGGPIGIPYVEVSGSQPRVPISFYYPGESDPGPYPIPPDIPIEGGPASGGDRHIIIVDRDARVLYEVYDAWPQPDGSWSAGSGAVWSLDSNALRPAGWTSADAAGLPILPGLVRYDEVASGEIRHAIRFTAPDTRQEFIWPARHQASAETGSEFPPMGQRFRLKADVDISGFSAEAQVILTALKRYGMILADNGAPWYIGGCPDERWNNEELHLLQDLHGSDFEAVDESSLMLDPDSAASRTP